MIIDLANVVTRPKAIELTFRSDEIDLGGDGAALARNASFHGETERVDGKAHVRGTIRAAVSIDCTRCLGPVERIFEIPFDVNFVEADDASEVNDREIGLTSLDESVAENGQIDLAEVVREQILLAMPDQVYCKEDCNGLCPQCGGNRNLIDCKCIEDEIDPRWAALKSLK